MSRIQSLAPGIFVAGQVQVEDIAEAAALGVSLVINNRPDGEDPGQPTSVEIETAVRARGLDYLSIPITGFPGPDQVQEVAKALSDGRSTLLYCRSGMRSAAAWALAVSAAGTLEPDVIRAAAARAGYNLSQLPL